MKKVAGIALFVLLQSVWAGNRPSVLFVNVDDWNDWNEVLRGHPQAATPHIARLAERGVVFSNAICSSPTCLPSRTALFSGVHPARSGNITNRNGINPWRAYVPDAVTLPKHLSRQGWKSIGIAKNFHGGDTPEFDTYIHIKKNVGEVPGSGSEWKGPRRWAYAAVPTARMPDYAAVSRGIEQINTAAGPLFLSLGIYRPHVPWVVPKEYFDEFPLEDIQLPKHRADDLDDLPERLKLLVHSEACFGKDFNKMLVASGDNKGFVRAYLACVTFADEQLGRLLDAWDASPHSKDGYVVLWSDHGYMLGEKEGWSKMKPWYDSGHCNLIFAGPGIPKGVVCNKAVSLQDIYPTLIDLLKLPSPPQKIDGNSLVPLLKNPDADWDKPVVMSGEEDGIRYDSVLDNDYRMTRLITGETELYKLADDPHEFSNLTRNPEYARVIERLSKHLTFRYPDIPQDGWIEAEAIPCQTSGDYKLRKNCHFRKPLSGASGERVVCADLHGGAGRPGSYLEFVLEVQTPGTYALGATLAAGGACTVLVDDVVDVAAQADTGYPMRTIGTVEASAELEDVLLGVVTFDQPGLKLIRFMSNVPKQRLQVDRIQFRREEMKDSHIGRRQSVQRSAAGIALAASARVSAAGLVPVTEKPDPVDEMVTNEVDVLVVGGGTAGTIAAIQAGRLGAKTLLVERGSQLGGTMTTGGVAFPGLFDAWGKQVIAGIGWELVRESVELDGGTLPDFSKIPPRHWMNQVKINQYLYPLLAEEKCEQAGVQIAYYESPQAITGTDKGWQVDCVGFGTRRRVLCRQIVDCTGGAEVVGMLGLPRLREDETQPGSILFRLGKPYQPGREGTINAIYVHGADSTNSRTVTAANQKGRKALLKKVRAAKGSGRLLHLQPEVSFRESYRIQGETMITVDDYTSGRVFEDAVCNAFYPVDLHTKSGVRPKPLKPGTVPTVPLRALIPKGSRNLIVAGRCVSSDRLANSGLRVQASCMAMGQAAGAAAALAEAGATTPLSVPLKDIHAMLRKHGAIVPSA